MRSSGSFLSASAGVDLQRDRLSTIVAVADELRWLALVASKHSNRKVILSVFNLVVEALVQLE